MGKMDKRFLRGKKGEKKKSLLTEHYSAVGPGAEPNYAKLRACLSKLLSETYKTAMLMAPLSGPHLEVPTWEELPMEDNKVDHDKV